MIDLSGSAQVGGTGARHRRPARHDLVERIAWGLGGLALAVAVWFAIVRSGIVPESGLPSPTAVAAASADLIGDATFRHEYADTLSSWARSLIIATVIAVPMGIVIGNVPALDRACMLVVHLGRSIPATTMIPVAIVLFGLGALMKISVVVFAIVWLILINTIYGVRSVDSMALTVARSLRFSWLEKVRWVLLPTAAPFIVTGVRVAAGVAFVVTLSAELLGAPNGVGRLLLSYQDSQQADFVYGGVLLVACTGMILNGTIQWLADRAIRWQPRPSQ